MCASPQKENGFTPIAHEILEALARTKLTTLESQAIFLILRNTYGYNRKVWQIKKWKVFDDFGIHKCLVKETLFKLSERQIIELDWKQKEIVFQKDYEKWQEVVPRQAIRERIVEQKVSQVTNNKVSQVTNNGQTQVSQVTNLKLVTGQTQVSQVTNSTPSKPALSVALPDPKDNLYILNIESKDIYIPNDIGTVYDKKVKQDNNYEKTCKLIQTKFNQFTIQSQPIKEALIKISEYPEEQQIKALEKGSLESNQKKIVSYMLNGLKQGWYDNQAQPKESNPNEVVYNHPPLIKSSTPEQLEQEQKEREIQKTKNRIFLDRVKEIENTGVHFLTAREMAGKEFGFGDDKV